MRLAVLMTAMAISDYRVVHEVPGRLRFRVPSLGEPGFEASYMEAWVEAVAAVTEVRANRPARTLIVHYRGDNVARAAVIQRLEAFSPEEIPGYSEQGVREAEIVPMVTTAMTLAVMPFLTPRLQKLLTFINISSTLVKGADTLLSRGIKMEVLDALAVGLAAANDKYYTANVTDFLLNLGEFLERRTARQSDRLLRRLLRPKPAMAWVEREGELVQVPGEEVLEGDFVTVGVGETVPVDGRVVEGAALVNQSAVTGEDVPVRKERPRRVISGSVVVEGRIRIEATQVGKDTTTARVARFIQESLGKRSDTQRLADELADKRVYLTLGTGGVIYALTRNLTRMESVFLVDYSCALKLGTPVAFKSGMYRAADCGVLMKGGEAIEHLANVDTVVFDKTGTLTHSELVVTEVVVLGDGGGVMRRICWR